MSFMVAPAGQYIPWLRGCLPIYINKADGWSNRQIIGVSDGIRI